MLSALIATPDYTATEFNEGPGSMVLATQMAGLVAKPQNANNRLCSYAAIVIVA